MSADTGKYIWQNGEYINWEDCKIHIMSHVIHYGSSVFEGIRCYQGKDNSVIFRLEDHMQRLIESAKIYRMDPGLSKEELCSITIDLIKKNNMKDCYIRPIIYRGLGAFGLLPDASKVETAVVCWGWGAYLGKEALEKGIDVKISTWNRVQANTLPFMSKAGGNYLNSQLIKMEAVMDGYQEGIALTPQGMISEGSGENVFLVKNGGIFTPPTSASILAGLTRHAIIMLARKLNIPVRQQDIPRETIYNADEAFFTGTAAEITPIKSVDKITIGSGSRGPVTEKLQKAFFDIIRQETSDEYNWLTKVY